MRSLLLIPGDDAEKLAKDCDSGADALILDLADSVLPTRKDAARQQVREYLQAEAGKGGPALFVRINPLNSGLADADLDVIMVGAPHGIVLPRSESGRDVTRLGAKLAVREAEYALVDGATRILPVTMEVARAAFQMGSYEGSSHRLAALAWGAQNLAAELGAEATRKPDGATSAPFQLARSLCLFAATAAGIAAIDTIFADFRDESGLIAEARQALHDGFSGKLAIHPAQVAPINSVFTPTPDAVARARRIIEAFAALPGDDGIALDGHIADKARLRQAERLLARARAAGVT